MSIAPGTRLGPYLVQESIGQGAMGVVYRAYHEQLERTGAVKVLMALSPDEETTARFRREAQSIAHMRHPNVLNVFDFGEHEGTPYMIVEYVEGGSLAARLKRASLNTKDALSYLRGIGSALDYAHSLGIVHRDVKPANVLLGRNDTPILADFGLAKLLQSSSIKSITGVTTGTPAYMAPEQVTGSQIGPAADRYSLAVMAFEMLSGSLPFDDTGVLEVLYAHVHREPPKPSARNEQLSGRVDAIILRGLAKDPTARWESCQAFVAALERVLLPGAGPEVERTVAFAPAQPEPRAAAVVAREAAPAAAVAERVSPQASAAMAPVPLQSKRERQRRGLMAVAAIVLLLLLLSSGVLIVVLNRNPTLKLNPTTVEAGGSVTVTATHIPKDQAGEIQLHSLLHTYPFRANGNGDVTQLIVIPIDTAAGDHVVAICWGGSCHAQQTLRVVSGAGLETPGTGPTPASSATPGTSPVGTTPTPMPGTTPSPKPDSSATSNPTHAPSPTPSPRSSPIPSPSVNPCPTPAPPAALSPAAKTAVGGTTVTYTGSHFTPNTTVTLTYRRNSATGTLWTSWAVNVGCDGGFTTNVTTPGSVVETDYVRACDVNNGCATAKISLVL